MAIDYSAETQDALERTGGIMLLENLAAVYESERNHSSRVGEMSMHVMAQLGADDREIITAGSAGKLHDVGKVDDKIRHMIRAPRKLFPREQLEIAKRHTALGASLISALNVSEEDRPLRWEASMAAFFHHHPPEHLAILRPASRVVRVVQIADRFDAMQDLERPYHTEGVLTAEEAAAEIRRDFDAANVFDSLADVALNGLLEEYGS